VIQKYFPKLSLFIIVLATAILCLINSLICIAAEKPSPKISADSYKFEFGEVEESSELKHTFKLTNRGKALLLINGAHSSCGCTVPKLTTNKLKPGESTDLSIIVDTAMKQGKITKTVSLFSNDPVNPELKFYLSMNVKNPHIGLTEENRAKIFTSDRCNSCHVARGTGLFGKDLYEADCAMCHGKLGLGAVGPQLLGPYENAAFKNAIEKIISYGSPTHRSMPGFLVYAGGPLGKEQIESISKYLAEVSKQRYYPGKIMPKK
jgi:hypothetical protein